MMANQYSTGKPYTAHEKEIMGYKQRIAELNGVISSYEYSLRLADDFITRHYDGYDRIGYKYLFGRGMYQAIEQANELRDELDNSLGVNCPTCGVEITVANAGGYRTYCEKCADEG